ncbi:MAG: CRTAC1 family protein [Planctomycetes bacterium]|nr:CRTAC1 family protein [Planctomycetota bacterium]
MVAQPLDLTTEHPELGPVDREGGEFWVSNPWKFEGEDFNLSMFENNCVFLNRSGKKFANISYLTGADLDSDTRSVAVGDFNHDGMPDILVRNIGGGPVRVFLNEFPKKNYLTVSLRGTRSNRQGIGARLICKAGGRRLVRDLFPENSFYSENPDEVTFGLGDLPAVDSLTILWPSGRVQELSQVGVNQRLVVTEK